MKNLILILSLCFILFSCFEKEEEVTVIPEEEIEVAPVEEGNIMECESAVKFIREVNLYPAPLEQEVRAAIEKYEFNNTYVYLLNSKGGYWIHGAPLGINSVCDTVCYISLVDEESYCIDWENAVFVENIWQDNR